ncbi:MAG: hypothetical protein HZA78_09025 [Candidatus Schekmanbacteria bacterium]|nr:hypothetical protein [Candidatus Schekmanbacteria bacterium]
MKHFKLLFLFGLCLGFIFLSLPANAVSPYEIKVYVNPAANKYTVKRVLILPFAYPADIEEPKPAERIEKLLRIELENINKYGLIPEGQVSEKLAGEKIAAAKLLRYPLAAKLGKSMDADGVILGSVSSWQETETSVSVRLITVADGQVLWSLTARKSRKGTTNLLVKAVITELLKNWIALGDTLATGILTLPLKAVESLNKVTLSWPLSPSWGIKRYSLQRGESPEGTFQELDSFSSIEKEYQYADKRLSEGRSYYYQYVIYTTDGLVSLPSEPVKAKLNAVPQTPQNFQVLSGLAQRVVLHWRANSEPDLSGYKIFRSKENSADFRLLKEISGRETEEYTDKDLESGVTYYYVMSAYYDDKHESLLTAPISAITKDAPGASTGLTAQGGPRHIIIYWQANPEADIKFYRLWSAEAPEQKFEQIAEMSKDTLRYADKDLDDAQTLYYKLQAVNSVGLAGAFSAPVWATTKALPAQVTGLSAVNEGYRIILTWQAGSGNDVIKYNVYRKAWLGLSKIGTVVETTYTDRDISPGKSYEYLVTAVDKDDLESGHSAPVTVTAR